LNSSEGPFYRKSEVLYNLNRARKAIQTEGVAILVEGYMDVIGVWSAGVRNVVATCGTALTPAQVRAMRRHAPALTLNFDPDNAGVRAAERAIAVVPVEEDMQLRVCSLQGGLDPDEYIQKFGAETYRQALAGAPNYWFWYADRQKSTLDTTTAEGRTQLFQILLREIHRVPDKVKRLSIANDLAEHVGIGQGMVLDEFRRAAAERRAPRPAIREDASLDANEVLLLHAMVGNAEARDQLLPVLRQLTVVQRYRTWPIIEAAMRLAEAGEPVSFASLAPRLADPERTLLSLLLLDDQERAGRNAVTTDQAVACVHTLARMERESHRVELKNRIREAERNGDMQEALRASQELVEMDRPRG
jgi:DNA primase